MFLLIALALGLALLVACLKVRAYRRAIRGLAQSVGEKQPFLREDQPAKLGADWDQLCAAMGGIITENTHLRQVRLSHLAQLEATLGSLQEAVLIVNDSNQILLANRALQAIFPRAQNILKQRLELVLHSRECLG